MAKKSNSTPQNRTLARIARTESYAEQVRAMFAATVNRILELNKSLPVIDGGEMFSFDAQTEKKRIDVERTLRQLHSVATTAIQQGIRLEWDAANAECDKLVQSTFGKKTLENPEFGAWTKRNGAAMRAFIDRTESGMNLSDRVWQSTRQLRDEMEIAMTVAIGDGTSAARMSRDVRKYLNDPDLMFRRFRYKDPETGEWRRKWKKRVIDPETGKTRFIDYDKDSYQDEWTGKGYYKSAAMNAMRVARTETNIAYRRADNARMQQMDFVLGQRVKLSRSHPKKDICDKLAGDYPKDFVFDGWHPQCFCYVTPITIDEDVYDKLMDEDDWREAVRQYAEKHQITDYPDNFTSWVNDNADKINAARARGTEPYFIRNNAGVIDNILNPDAKSANVMAQPDSTLARTPQDIAAERHAARTPEDIERIQTEWNRRRLWMANSGIEQLDLFTDKTYQELVRLLEEDIALGEHKAFEHDFAEMKRMITAARDVEYMNTERMMKSLLFRANNDALESAFGARGTAMPFRPANELRGNPNYLKDESYRVNCQTCVVANELRRRGFNIEAMANTKGSALEKLSYHTESAWIDADGKIPTSNVSGLRKVKRKRWDGTEYEAWEKTCKNRKQMFAALESDITEDGRYHIKWTWAKKNCGHIITVERVGGKFRYYDPQNGKVITDFVGYIDGIKTAGGIRWLRVDTLRVHPDIAKKILTKPTNATTSGKAATGGMGAGINVKAQIADYVKARNIVTTNAERVALDKAIIKNGGFIRSEYHSTKNGSIFATEELPKKITAENLELSKNIQMAKKVANNGFDVYLLSNPQSTKSADFIFAKAGKIYYTEGKLSTGKNSLGHNLTKGATQSDRIIIDLTGTNNTNYIASRLVEGFQQNTSLKEVMLLKGRRLITIDQMMISRKNFKRVFKLLWEKQK